MRRPLAAALLALGLCSCHEDASVQQVFVPPVPSALGVTASGGNAGATAAVAGDGGAGGSLLCDAVSSLSIGTLTTQPTAPPTPSAPVPTASDVPVPNGSDDNVPIPGNLFINSTVTTALGDGTITFTSTNGDIVVSSTLIAFDPGAGKPVDLEFLAPNGTVWITGTVRTTNTDPTLDGDAGGSVFIQAARVVITGTIDTRGEAHSTGAGGNGGDVSVYAVNSYALLGSGTIQASGGNGATTAGNGATLLFDSAQKLNLYGTITANGGAVSGSSNDAVVGGDGGLLTVDSLLAIDLVGTFNLRGGSVSTSGDGAAGGQGGGLDVVASAGVPLRLYGALDVSGGSASAADVGAGIDGGAGGQARLGDGAPLLSIETGVGTYGFNGGTGELQGGDGGLLDFDGATGQLLLGGTLQAQGGLSSGGGGGNGGVISAFLSGPGIVSSTATLNVSSGASAGGGTPVAGSVSLIAANGDLTLSGSIVASGGSSSGPVPPVGGIVTATCTAGGVLSCSASVSAVGGASTAAGALDGGAGGALYLLAPHPTGTVSLSGPVNLDGGASTGTGTGGVGGLLTINTRDDAVSVGTSVVARGGAALGAGGTGGQGGRVFIDSDDDGNGVGGDVTLAAGSTIDVSGGSGTTGGDARNAVPGDAVDIEADGNDSNSLLTNGRVNLAGSVFARGGATGGDGGTVRVDGRNAAGTAVPPAVTTVSVTANGAGTAGAVVAQ